MEEKKEITLNNSYCSNKNCHIPLPEILNRLHKESKLTWKQLADIYETSERTIRRHARQSAKKRQKIKLKRGRKRKIEGKDLDYLSFYAIFYTLTFKAVTQKFLAGRFSWILRKKISQPTICRALKRARVSYKRFTYQASEQLRPSNKEKIEYFINVLFPYLLKIGAKIFFLDESGFHFNMAPKKGYYFKGKRLFSQKPGNKGENQSLILLAQIANGEKIIHWRTVEGGVNSEKFHKFLSEFNPPNNGKKNVLIMDNLSSHRATDSCRNKGLSTIEELAKSKGIEVIFLPSYTPEINPIEEMNNIIKQHTRARQARNKEKLDSAIEEKIKVFKEESTVKYLNSSIKECKEKLASAERTDDFGYKLRSIRDIWKDFEPKESCQNFIIKKRITNVKIDIWQDWENGHLNWIA